MSTQNRGLLVIVGVFIVILVVGQVLMGGMMGAGFMGPGMMGWGYTGGPAGTNNVWLWGLGMALGALMMLAFWGALIVGIALVMRSALVHLRSGAGSNSPEEPLTILRRRYAAGEIDQATFERMRSELGHPHQQTVANGRIEATR
jgi:putative membrane protein